MAALMLTSALSGGRSAFFGRLPRTKDLKDAAEEDGPPILVPWAEETPALSTSVERDVEDVDRERVEAEIYKDSGQQLAYGLEEGCNVVSQ